MTKLVIFETNKNKISIANFDEKKSDLTLLLACFWLQLILKEHAVHIKKKLLQIKKKRCGSVYIETRFNQERIIWNLQHLW